MNLAVLVLPLLLALALALVVTPVVGRMARRLGILDRAESSRKIHGSPVPRLGGVAVVAGALAALLGAAMAMPAVRSDPRLPWLFGCALGAAGLGLADDVRGVAARHKLSVQLALAAAAWCGGLRVEAVALPFGAPIDLGLLSLPVTMLWLAGAANAVNLVDGLDGLAGGVAAVAAVAASALAMQRGDVLMAVTAAGVAGASLGFLRHNLHPASIFLGDGGSLFLGFALAAAVLPARVAAGAAMEPLPALLLLALPVADTSLAILRRAVSGAPIFAADRDHLHHRLLARGLSHPGAVAALHVVAGLHAAAALALVGLRGPAAASAILALAVADAAGLVLLGYRPAALPGLLARRARNLRLRRGVHEAEGLLGSATQAGEVLRAVERAAPALGARGARLDLAAGAVASASFAADAGRARTRVGLGPHVRTPAALELEWDASEPFDRDVEIAVERLSAGVRAALCRIERARIPAAASADGALRLASSQAERRS